MSVGAAEPWLPPGMWTNDNWFARDGETYHAFYLMVPRCMGNANDWGLRGRLTIVIISHRGALADLADREIRLENGAIVTTREAPAP